MLILLIATLCVTLAFATANPPRPLSVVFRCPHCGREYRGIDAVQEFVDHLWEAHRHPSEVRLNGEVYRSGPSPVLDRFVLRSLAELKLR